MPKKKFTSILNDFFLAKGACTLYLIDLCQKSNGKRCPIVGVCMCFR